MNSTVFAGAHSVTEQNAQKPHTADTASASPKNAEAARRPATADGTDIASAAAFASAPCAAATAAPVSAAPATSATDAPAHVTYADCIRGKVGAPKNPAEKSIFQLLMVGGMVTCMVTFNGLIHTGPAFFADSHWLYPIVFCIAMLVRVFIANRIVDRVAPRFILSRFEGFKRSVSMTLLNVGIMSPIMGSIVTLLLNGPDNLLWEIAAALPITACAAVLVNLLFVGPAVRCLFYNVITPTASVRLVQSAQRNLTNWSGIWGC